MKTNPDAAVDVNARKTGLGVIIQDSAGVIWWKVTTAL